jgi:hypothetical protein
MTFSRALSCACALIVGGSTLSQNAVIQAALNAVSIDTLVHDMQQLTGELPVNVDGSDVLIVSRNKFNSGNHTAALWLEQRLISYGYTTTMQSFSGGTGENVLATKTGLVYPGRKVVICGHYDAMPGGPVAAPAADDDGSGTCSTLEAARVLASYDFENTIVFALWDEEEQGKLGSEYYAGVAAGNDDTLIAVINMDAISYDGDSDGLIRIHTKNIANSIAIKDTALAVNTAYGLDLNIAVNNPGATYSDHASFWAEGYGSILVIEDFDNDGNPHYHTSTDLLQYLDLPYWAGLTRLSIGTTATFAVPMLPEGVTETTMQEHMTLSIGPNPCDTWCRVWLRTPASQRVQLRLVDELGRVVCTMNEGMLSRGEHAFELTVADLAPGSYSVVASWAGGRAATTLVRLP